MSPRQPHEGKEPVCFDTTAGVCAASGLMEIAEWIPDLEKSLYQKVAVLILQAIEKKYANWNVEEDSIVSGGTAAYHSREEDFDVPIIYGDYFFIEAIFRLRGQFQLLW